MTMTSPFLIVPSRIFSSACFLGIEHARRAGELQAFLAGDFGHGAFGREVAVQDDEMAVLLDRIVEAAG